MHQPLSHPQITHWQNDGFNMMRVDLASNTPVELKKIFHDDIAIMAFTKSTWKSVQNGKTYEETPDCVIIRDAGQVFSVKTSLVQDGATCREIRVTADKLRELYEVQDNPLPAINFSNPVLKNKVLHDRLIYAHTLTEANNCTLQESSSLAAIVALVARESSGKAIDIRQDAKKSQICLVVDYLREHYSQNVTLKELAQVAQTNPFVLIRQFGKEVGMTPCEYLLAYRINRAKQFLQNGVRILDVAHMCGFSDQSHFTRKFKRMVGVTPGKFQPLS